jgi:hypothetical protein
MSKSAKKKRSLPPPTPPGDKEGSGRFAIGSQGKRPATVLPPASPHAQSAEALEALPLLDIEPDADAPEPQRGLVSGVFNNASPATPVADDELEAAVTSLHAYYSAHERNHERAELVIEDLSLRLDNPYAASSLVPPPKKPFPVAKVAGIAAALIALGSGAWFASRALPLRTEDNRTTAAAPAVSTQVAQVETAPAIATPVAIETVKPTPVVAETAPVAPEPQQPIQAQIEAVASAPRVAQAPRIAPQAAAKPSVISAPAPVEADTTAAAHPVQTADDNVADVALRAALGNAQPQHAETPASAAASGEATKAAPSGEAASTTSVDDVQPAAAAVAVQDLGALPETPSREDVIAGFEAVRGPLSACAGAKHGVVQIDATIASSGRVSRSLIAGVFQGTPEGSCMARIARTARFPQFSQPSLNVNFPISL